MIYRECHTCGREFATRRKTAKYCSYACHGIAQRNKLGPEIIEANSIPEPNSGCWLWTGTVSSVGYGIISVNYENWSSHRLSYAVYHGAIPPGKWVLHRCDNYLCVNPDHLYAGTPKNNTQDAMQRGRMTRGSRINTAVLHESQIPQIRKQLEAGVTCAAIAAELGVDRTTINCLKLGKSWRHI